MSTDTDADGRGRPTRALLRVDQSVGSVGTLWNGTRTTGGSPCHT